MSATEQVSNFQVKVQEKLAQFQKVAQERAKGLEVEAKKAFDLFGDRAQAELKQFLATAQHSTREQWSKFGGELVKLGEKVQQMAHESQAAGEAEKIAEADKAATEVH